MALNKKYAYYLNMGSLGLVEKGTDGQWGSVSTTDKNLKIFCSKKAQHMVPGTLDSSYTSQYQYEIPEQFHEALVYKVIAMGYKEPRNMKIELAQYFDMEYDKILKEAKKYVRSNYQTTGQIVPQEF